MQARRITCRDVAESLRRLERRLLAKVTQWQWLVEPVDCLDVHVSLWQHYRELAPRISLAQGDSEGFYLTLSEAKTLANSLLDQVRSATCWPAADQSLSADEARLHPVA
jgi:hypothetical protein